MKSKVLVLTPGYPSRRNPYTCAFVHARVKEYGAQGLDVSVCQWNPSFEYSTTDEYDGVSVLKCNPRGVRDFIEKSGPYSVIVAHFADLQMLQILERESHRSEIVLVSHGADILGAHFFCHAGGRYFEPEEDEYLHYDSGLPKKEYLRRLRENDAIHWVFVSDSLKQIAEDTLGFKFDKNAHVIGNWIREDRFVYEKKDPEQRKKIYFCRRFDDEKVYCIDTVMLGIRRLANREFFKELEFHIYGDGNDYDRLIAPVLEFDNVKLHRRFTDNHKLPELLKTFGIGLFPSRYDSQPVAIQEAAQSGVVCIGGDIPAVRNVFPADEFGTLINPESPDELASLIEKLYRNPALFTDLSERMSRRVASLSCKEKTINAECELIRRLAESPLSSYGSADGTEEKLLSVIVPAFNMEKYLDVCVDSLVAHDRVKELEVLLVNDGSKDATLDMANKWAQRYPNVVKVIDKENGGHGSCINVALSVAKGKYVRIVDADDWVVSSNLARQIERLRTEDADCVLTYGQYDYIETGKTAPVIQYPNLTDGMPRMFDDMQFAGYGFKGYGPLLSTASWKRTVLLESQTKIIEGVSYADMLWNIMPLNKAETVVLYDLDIYRYTMGREGQSVSRSALLKRWADHNRVFFEVARFALEDKGLTPSKRKYVLHNILGELGCNNIYVLYIARGLDEVDKFLESLQRVGSHDLTKEVVQFTCNQHGDSRGVLFSTEIGRMLVSVHADESERGGDEPVAGKTVKAKDSTFFRIRTLLGRLGVKKLIKAALPYGIVRRWQQDIYRM